MNDADFTYQIRQTRFKNPVPDIQAQRFENHAGKGQAEQQVDSALTRTSSGYWLSPPGGMSCPSPHVECLSPSNRSTPASRPANVLVESPRPYNGTPPRRQDRWIPPNAQCSEKIIIAKKGRDVWPPEEARRETGGGAPEGAPLLAPLALAEHPGWARESSPPPKVEPGRTPNSKRTSCLGTSRLRGRSASPEQRLLILHTWRRSGLPVAKA